MNKESPILILASGLILNTLNRIWLNDKLVLLANTFDVFKKIFVFTILYLNKRLLLRFLKFIHTVNSLQIAKKFFSKSSILLQNSTKLYLQNAFLNIFL